MRKSCLTDQQVINIYSNIKFNITYVFFKMKRGGMAPRIHGSAMMAALAYAFWLRGQWPEPLTLAGIALLVAGVIGGVRVKAV